MIPFCMTDKVKGIPISKTFISNIIATISSTKAYITLTLPKIFVVMHIHSVTKK